MKKMIKFFVVMIMILSLVACGNTTVNTGTEKETTTSGTEKETTTSGAGGEVTEVVDIEDALVGETKNLALQMAEFAQGDKLLLYTNVDSVIEVAANFSMAVTQYDEPLSAKRYIIDRNSISQNPSGGAMTHDEILAHYSAAYPSMINNQKGVVTVAAASILTIETAYPQPTGFSGTQIIELRYSSEIGVWAVYSETENGTLQCVILPLIGEIAEDDTFVNIATSGDMGTSFRCDVYNCDPAVSCSIHDCQMVTDCNILSSKDGGIEIAKLAMKAVGKRANTFFLNMVQCPDPCYAYSLSCQEYATFSPTSVITWSVDDVSGIYNLSGSLRENKLLESKLVQGVAGYLCSNNGNMDMLASQSIMETTTSFRIDGNMEPTIIWLIYEDEEGYFVGNVSIYTITNGCVLVNASPLWGFPMTDDTITFYNTGNPINQYAETLNNWLASGRYIKVQ